MSSPETAIHKKHVLMQDVEYLCNNDPEFNSQLQEMVRNSKAKAARIALERLKNLGKKNKRK